MSRLTPREETILSSIVRQYIERALPVSSVSILEECGLDVSSATVRNDVARLEEEGYIVRPHYAAGSIPSDQGYRHYVSTLSPPQLPLEEQFLINHLFHQVEDKLEEWLNLAATLLARQTRSVAVVTAPRPAAARFKHTELVSLQPQLALAVLVLEGAKVHQQLIGLNEPHNQEGLSQLAASLNKKLTGLSTSRVRTVTAKLIESEKLVAQSILRMMEAGDKHAGREIFLDGWHYLLSQPEFSHSARLAGLMSMVEERRLIELMHTGKDACVQVFIGRENQAEAIKECSLLISSYGLPDEPLGTMAVVGPTRMAYQHAISVLGYIASLISVLVADLYGASPQSIRQNTS
ncbi:MAG: heat-inducible transcriptional repressor HrcA [Dehalococcoidia bacterium]|nr:heat-inducible transcriptional repressor HrcA [Dehalococcoidia bacterium]